jgi:hypothetical protein
MANTLFSKISTLLILLKSQPVTVTQRTNPVANRTETGGSGKLLGSNNYFGVIAIQTFINHMLSWGVLCKPVKITPGFNRQGDFFVRLKPQFKSKGI